MDPAYRKRLSFGSGVDKQRGAKGERFIPRRVEDQQTLYELSSPAREGGESTYDLLLRSEVLGTPPKNILQFSANESSSPEESSFTRSPMRPSSQRLLASPKRSARKISRTPFKMLEAPGIQDDFYLNLVDWSSRNILAVGLNSSVYLWNAATGCTEKMMELPDQQLVTSVRWVGRGTHLAVGTMRGRVVIWDVEAKQCIRSYSNHNTRVGALDWNHHLLSSGSRDRIIFHRDVRTPEPFCAQLRGHKQEVCGIEWSPDGRCLASGGNDNTLLVWDNRADQPTHRFEDHTAAVKALSWSPHQRGLLVSGGGTADRSMRFRDVLTGEALHHFDTGSQVCNLAWSKNVNEIVSTHGFSQNQVAVWSYPSLAPLATLSGHTTRVLYLAVSPDGTTVVTGAGDETLRFWNIFPPRAKCQTLSRSGSLEIR